MNKARRKEIQKVILDIETLVQSILGEEQDAFDNMPENLQGSEKYEKADEACDNLSEAVDNLEEVISSIEAAIE